MASNTLYFICALFGVISHCNGGIAEQNFNLLSEPSDIRNGQCGGTIELDSGTLTYPGEGEILPGELCIWTIHLREMDGFRMNFTNMDLPGNGANCLSAAVTIYGLSNLVPNDSPEKYRFCDENNNAGYHFLTGTVATVVFYTGADFPEGSSHTGFALHWQGSRFQPTPIMHSSTYTSSATGVVWYPVVGEYPPNSALTWLINGEGPENSPAVDIYVNAVDFESCNRTFDRCLCDALILYNIDASGDLHEMQRFCGDTGGEVFTNASSNFIVAFFSDDIDYPGSGEGFQLSWRQPGPVPTTVEPPSTTEDPSNPIIRACGGILEGQSGVIEYKIGEGEEYGPLERCVWTIRSDPASMQIQLTKTQSGFMQNVDWLSAFSIVQLQGLSTTAQIGRSSNGVEGVTMQGSVVILVFTSEPGSRGRGFRLEFEALGATDLVHSHTDENTNNPVGEVGRLSYVNYELSTYVISNGYRYNYNNGPRLELTIQSYGFESGTGCPYDGLFVYELQRQTLRQLGRYCGNIFQPLDPLYSGDTFVLVLYSDYSNIGAGFRATYRIES